MRYKRKIIILIVLIILLTIMEYAFPGNPHVVLLYDKYLFRPYQTLRNYIFGFIPISVGDILYLAGALAIIVVLGKWVYFAVKFRTHRSYLVISILHTIITIGVLYALFIMGWGANYYKPKLADYWHLEVKKNKGDSSLEKFDSFLVEKLNEYAPHYHELPFKIVDKRTQEYYRKYTDCYKKMSGLNVKPSIFGYLMQNLGIQGYYNPFTGEAQVNRFLPGFMLPFVIGHEMAHQSGIAAEGDANLMSYVIGTSVADTAFNYSCYLNIWLYTQAQLREVDTSMAKQLWHRLNKITAAHIDTLRQIRLRYRGKLSHYSGRLYDEYLRLHDQKGGIMSYDDVVFTAWAWEQSRKRFIGVPISVP